MMKPSFTDLIKKYAFLICLFLLLKWVSPMLTPWIMSVWFTHLLDDQIAFSATMESLNVALFFLTNAIAAGFVYLDMKRYGNVLGTLLLVTFLSFELGIVLFLVYTLYITKLHTTEITEHLNELEG